MRVAYFKWVLYDDLQVHECDMLGADFNLTVTTLY